MFFCVGRDAEWGAMGELYGGREGGGMRGWGVVKWWNLWYNLENIKLDIKLSPLSTKAKECRGRIYI